MVGIRARTALLDLQRSHIGCIAWSRGDERFRIMKPGLGRAKHFSAVGDLCIDLSCRSF